MSASDSNTQRPWWRYPLVWMVIGGPLVVVVASVTTFFIAAHRADAVLIDETPRVVPKVRQGDDSNLSLAPALQARNHAATGVVPDQKGQPTKPD